MKKRIALFIFIIATILWTLFIGTILSCYGAEKKDTKKIVSQSTSKENKIRKQDFNQCLKYNSRSYCYYLYY